MIEIENAVEQELFQNMYLIGDIEDEIVMDLIKEIHQAEMDGVEVIDLYINTEGGRIDSALSLANVIKNSDIHFNVYNLGIVASAGMIIYFAGDRKISYGTSLFMIHGSLLMINGILSKDEMDKVLKHNERDEKLMDMFVKSLLSEKAYSKFQEFSSNKQDNYFSTQEALEFEMLDDVINAI